MTAAIASISFMSLLVFAAASLLAYVDVRLAARPRVPARTTVDACRSGALCLADQPPPLDIDEAMSAMDKAVSREDYAEAARLKKLIDAQVEVDRAQLTRQLFGGGAPSAESEEAPSVSLATSLAPGQILVASPERFCSRNPFAWPVMDMSRFGIEGPVRIPGLPADRVAMRLPVLVLLEHSERKLSPPRAAGASHLTLDTARLTPHPRHSRRATRRSKRDTRHSTLDTRHSTPDAPC